MYLPYNKVFIERSRTLRKNMTNEERKLWYCYLSKHPIRFLRQKTIGNYITDFYCPKAKLVIEIDGSQHYTQDGIEYDKHRTKVLNAYGLNVIRFTNSQINVDFNNVCRVIERTLSRYRDSSLQ